MKNETIQTLLMALALAFQISMQTDTRPILVEKPQNIVVSVTVSQIEPVLREKTASAVPKKEEIPAKVKCRRR